MIFYSTKRFSFVIYLCASDLCIKFCFRTDLILVSLKNSLKETNLTDRYKILSQPTISLYRLHTQTTFLDITLACNLQRNLSIIHRIYIKVSKNKLQHLFQFFAFVKYYHPYCPGVSTLSERYKLFKKSSKTEN